MARRSPQIPLDDDPVEIDLDDLPTDEELEAAATAPMAEPAALPPGRSTRSSDGDVSPLALFQLWFVLVVVCYLLVGLAVGMTMAFRGAAQFGFAAFTHPGFYTIVLFWPIALWQIFWNQL